MEYFINLGFVEADDDGAVDVYYRYAHLSGLLYRFGCIGMVRLNVADFICDAKFVKVLFDGVAEGTPVSAVNNWFRIHAFYYTTLCKVTPLFIA